MTASIRPVILAGGAGKNLWPVSRAVYPKQFQCLFGQHTLLQETALRVRSPSFSSPLVVCSEEHRFIVAEQLAECGITPEKIILEPAIRGTSAAIALATLWMKRHDADGLMLVLPADHAIDRPDDFVETVLRGTVRAEKGDLVTFGVSAKSIKTELGYLLPLATDSSLLSAGAKVSRFEEKPDSDTAEDMLSRGALWNTGIFLFSADACLRELARFSPLMLEHCSQAFEQSEQGKDFLRVGREPFLQNPLMSFDELILENTDRAVVFLLDDGWQDLRTWMSVHDKSPASDKNGNVTHGDIIALDCTNSHIHSNGMLTAAIGLENKLVVATEDAILVTDLDSTEHVDVLVDEIARSGARQHLYHPVIYQPWGSYRTILKSSAFRVKELVIKPGKSLSPRKHKDCAEHCIVVEGTVNIRFGGDEILLWENQSTYIPIGSPYRLANPGRIPLRIVEIQSGSHLGGVDGVDYDEIQMQ